MANDFSFDSSCVALYRFEAANILADSKGSNTLSNSGPAAADTSVYQEGAASCQFDVWDYLSRANGDLSNDFPGKNGTTNKDITVCAWIYSHSGGYGSKGPIFSIYQYADYSGLIFLHENNATLDCVIGYGTGAESHARGYTFSLGYNGESWDEDSFPGPVLSEEYATTILSISHRLYGGTTPTLDFQLQEEETDGTTTDIFADPEQATGTWSTVGADDSGTNIEHTAIAAGASINFLTSTSASSGDPTAIRITIKFRKA